MKRIVTILMCCLAVICANAQIVQTVSSRTQIEKQKKERTPLKFEFYGKVGLNIMSADWGFRVLNTKVPNSKSHVGFDIDFGFMSNFRPSNPSNFYWGAELSLTQVGGGYDEFTGSWNSDHFDSYSFSDIVVVLSPSIGWKKGITDDISLDIHLNPGVAYKFKTRDNPAKCLALAMSPSVAYKFKTRDNPAYSFESIDKQVYCSLKGGVGIWYKRFNLDFSYRKLTNFSSNYVDYSNILISVGYRF